MTRNPFPLLKLLVFGNFDIAMVRVNTHSIFIFVILCLSTLSSVAQWQVVSYQKREYVTLKSFCDFYGYNYQPLSEKKYSVLTGPRGQIKFSLNSRDAIINGVKYNLSFPIVSNRKEYLVSKADVNALFEPILRPEKIKRKERVNTVIIDAGHGGSDRGARSRVGDEKIFALDVSKRLKKILERKGYRTIMTRSNDTFIPLDRRVSIAGNKSDSIFVSIHFNQGQRKASGIETFALAPRGAPGTMSERVRVSDFQGQSGNRSDEQNILLATAIHRTVMKNTNTLDRGVKRARFWVLRYNNIPAVLFEGGFLSNSNEARMIARESYRETLARSIADGIVEYDRIMRGDRGSSGSPEIRPVQNRRNQDEEESASERKPTIEVADNKLDHVTAPKPTAPPTTTHSGTSQPRPLGRGLVYPAKKTEPEPSPATPEHAPEVEKVEPAPPPRQVQSQETPSPAPKKSTPSVSNKPVVKPAPVVAEKKEPVIQTTPTGSTYELKSADEILREQKEDILILSQPEVAPSQPAPDMATEISVSKLLEMASTNDAPEKIPNPDPEK